MDESLLREAFTLHEWGRRFDGLNQEIYRILFSETFYLPGRQTIAVRISERIMDQQLALVRSLIPLYREFLDAAHGGSGGDDAQEGIGDR